MDVSFERAEREYLENNNLLALWDVVWRCERDNIPKPEWARQGLLREVEKLIVNLSHPGRMGSKALYATDLEDFMWDCRVFGRVGEYMAIHECDEKKAIRMIAKQAVNANAPHGAESAMRRRIKRALIRMDERGEKGFPYTSPALSHIKKP